MALPDFDCCPSLHPAKHLSHLSARPSYPLRAEGFVCLAFGRGVARGSKSGVLAESGENHHNANNPIHLSMGVSEHNSGDRRIGQPP